MYKVELTNLQQEVLRFLFVNAGKKFNARGLAIALGVSQPAVSKALPLLEKKEFIIVNKDKESKRLEIGLNRDSQLVMGMKRSENLRMIYESGLHDFLFNAFPGCTVILFGSFAKGEDNFKSDIDIAVVGSKHKEIDTGKFAKLLGKEVRINFYGSWDKIDKNLRNNILGGIILSGWVDL